MKKSILLSVFGVVSIILFSFSSKSFLHKFEPINFEITNGTGENIDSLAIFSHGSNDMHLVVLEGGALNPNEIETFTIDGVEGDYDIVFHETNGLYLKNEFTADKGDKSDEGGKAYDVIPNKSKAGEGDLTDFKADEVDLVSTTYNQPPSVNKARLRQVTGGAKITILSISIRGAE
jgi:hypothetical protein